MTRRSDLAEAEWWTLSEAATMLRVDKSTISRYAAQGAPHRVITIPTRKTPRTRLLFRRQALSDWIDHHTHEHDWWALDGTLIRCLEPDDTPAA